MSGPYPGSSEENQVTVPLSYRLRPRVSLSGKEESLILVLDWPLKSMTLNPFWRPVFKCLARDGFVPIERIAKLAAGVDPGRIEPYLNSLVRKGFLEQIGVSKLSHYPTVSVIIPVRNRPEEIRTCLDSLKNLDWPAEKMEIIVIDDHSDDHTPDVISAYPVKLLSLQSNKQASFCRNMGARKAQGEVLAFIDSDCLADPLWLKELIPAFKDNSVGAVGGLIDSYYEHKVLERYEKSKSSLKVGTWFKRSGEGDPFFYVPSCNLLVRKEPFFKVGGFEETLHVGEDVDLCWRLQDMGQAVEYRPQGTVFHKHRSRVGPFCRRRFDYGTSEPLLQRIHNTRIKRMVFPPAGLLFWLILILPMMFGGAAWSGLSAILWLIHSLIKYRRVRLGKSPIRLHSIMKAVIREYLALFYHSCAFVSRYYLVGVLVLGPFFPLISISLLGAHLLAGLVDYFIKKPDLNPLSFLFYFTLDQLFYQAGVWWGCIKGLNFHPVNPRIEFRSNIERAS